jgi:hypothetical protein
MRENDRESELVLESGMGIGRSALMAFEIEAYGIFCCI